jgi:hypothetical protein
LTSAAGPHSGPYTGGGFRSGAVPLVRGFRRLSGGLGWWFGREFAGGRAGWPCVPGVAASSNSR